MQISFTFDNPADAARVLEFLNDGDWPSADAGRPTRSGANASRGRGAGGGSASVSADEPAPWEDDEPRGSQRSAAAYEDDPWADDPAPASKPSRARSGPSKAKSADAELRTKDVNAPGGFQRWELGYADAPECECGDPAAKVSGWKGKDSDRGKPSWVAWRCAKGAGKNWKDKCDFFEGAR